MDLHLTNEQAEWLKKHLDSLLEEAHWGRAKLDKDHKEHAYTIYSKINKELTINKWVNE